MTEKLTMRWPLLIVLAFFGTILANEQPVYPLWNGHESVTDYAERVKLPCTKTLALGNGVKLELVLIPAGKFIMGTPAPAFSLAQLPVMTVIAGLSILHGANLREEFQPLEKKIAEYQSAVTHSSESELQEKPAHSVTLTKPFYLGKFVVTQEQYQQTTGTNPSNFKGNDLPVEKVSWNDTQQFCKLLCESTHQIVRLPTEAEWEFACRAGTMSRFYCGETVDELGRSAWYARNYNEKTHPVGQKEANAFGLFDMLGNVCEWCQDFYANDYYAKSPVEDPQGPADCAVRVFRGGHWAHFHPRNCRSAYRDMAFPSDTNAFISFRVAVTIEPLAGPNTK